MRLKILKLSARKQRLKPSERRRLMHWLLQTKSQRPNVSLRSRPREHDNWQKVAMRAVKRMRLQEENGSDELNKNPI